TTQLHNGRWATSSILARKSRQGERHRQASLHAGRKPRGKGRPAGFSWGGRGRGGDWLWLAEPRVRRVTQVLSSPFSFFLRRSLESHQRHTRNLCKWFRMSVFPLTSPLSCCVRRLVLAVASCCPRAMGR